MLLHFLLTSSIYRCLVRIWPVWRKPHQYKPDQAGVCDHVNLKTLVQTQMSDMNGNDSRYSIWFPNKVHCSSQNKFAECRKKMYFLALKHANLKETQCMAIEVIFELA